MNVHLSPGTVQPANLRCRRALLHRRTGSGQAPLRNSIEVGPPPGQTPASQSSTAIAVLGLPEILSAESRSFRHESCSRVALRRPGVPPLLGAGSDDRGKAPRRAPRLARWMDRRSRVPTPSRSSVSLVEGAEWAGAGADEDAPLSSGRTSMNQQQTRSTGSHDDEVYPVEAAAVIISSSPLINSVSDRGYRTTRQSGSLRHRLDSRAPQFRSGDLRQLMATTDA